MSKPYSESHAVDGQLYFLLPSLVPRHPTNPAVVLVYREVVVAESPTVRRLDRLGMFEGWSMNIVDMMTEAKAYLSQNKPVSEFGSIRARTYNDGLLLCMQWQPVGQLSPW